MLLLIKSGLLLLSAAIFFHGFKAPTPAVDSKRDVYKGQVFEHVVHIIVRNRQRWICFPDSKPKIKLVFSTGIPLSGQVTLATVLCTLHSCIPT